MSLQRRELAVITQPNFLNFVSSIPLYLILNSILNQGNSFSLFPFKTHCFTSMVSLYHLASWIFSFSQHLSMYLLFWTFSFLFLRYFIFPSQKIMLPTIHSSQDMEATQTSIDRWMDKEDVVYTHTHTHTHNGILLNHKTEWNNAICTNMNGQRHYHTKWSKSENDISYDITYM